MTIDKAVAKAFDSLDAEQKTAVESGAGEQEETTAPAVADAGGEEKHDAPPETEEAAPDGEAVSAQQDEKETAAAVEPDLSGVPENMPADWKNIIKQNPAAKDAVLKQFRDGNRLIYKKSTELSNLHNQVQAYMGALTQDLTPVIKERFGGDTNAFAADVNRMIKSLYHPEEWRRYEAIEEIVAAVLPNGFDTANLPDKHVRSMMKMLERQQQPAPRQEPQQRHEPVRDEATRAAELIQQEFDNLSRYNSAAKKFIEDEANSRLINEKYRQATEANPHNSVGANAIEAVRMAMDEQATKAAESAAQRQAAAKREAARGLAFGSSQKQGDGERARQVGIAAATELAWEKVVKSRS